MPNHRSSSLVLLLLGLVIGCAPRRPAPAPRPAARPAVHVLPRLAPLARLAPAAPKDVALDPALPARLDSIVGGALADGMSPGAAVAVARWGRVVHSKGYGHTDWDPAAARVDASTIYDLASLTKVVATTTAAMILEEEGRLALDSAVAFYLPELAATDTAKRYITVRMLLTHRGGFEAYAPLHHTVRGRESYLAEIARRPLKSPPGTLAVYSDWDMVLLGLVIERITGRTLDAFAAERVFRPLGMGDTGFLPDTSNEALVARIAPTEADTGAGGLGRGVLRGVVHDGNAWALGGVSGHAGLFSSLRDLSTFAQMLLNGGTYGGTRIVKAETVARWTAPQDIGSTRAIGWDTPAANSSAGRFFSPRSFGHTGFTGTSMWMDPERGIFVIVLTNRVNPRGTSERHVRLRRDVADAVQEAVLDAPVVELRP
jgi:CubicO group peptidase (beta-lactamase class C family)